MPRAAANRNRADWDCRCRDASGRTLSRWRVATRLGADYLWYFPCAHRCARLRHCRRGNSADRRPRHALIHRFHKKRAARASRRNRREARIGETAHNPNRSECLANQEARKGFHGRFKTGVHRGSSPESPMVWNELSRNRARPHPSSDRSERRKSRIPPILFLHPMQPGLWMPRRGRKRPEEGCCYQVGESLIHANP